MEDPYLCARTYISMYAFSMYVFASVLCAVCALLRFTDMAGAADF